MYLHVGNKKTVLKKNVVAIFDADSATISRVTVTFLSEAEKKGLLEMAVEEIPKSFVLYKEHGQYKICFSQLAPSVLIGRLQSPYPF